MVGADRALVVFDGTKRHTLSPFLDPDFQHCFVAVQMEHAWVVMDGGFRNTHINSVAPTNFDLKSHYENHGYIVHQMLIRPVETINPLMIGSCVGMVKRVIGIRAPFVWTPLQLYRHLERK